VQAGREGHQACGDAVIGDRWHLRDGAKLRGLAITVRRFAVEHGAEPTAQDAISGFDSPDSRWLTVEALRANAHARVATDALVEAHDIPGGVRTRQRIIGTIELPGCDIVQEETLS
jgi:hypothetical protein